MKKVSVICMSGLDNFIDNIIDGLSDGYMVRKFIVKTDKEIYNAIDWGDIIWLEWANQSAIIATNYEGIKGKKVILRLHSYEVFTDYPKQINWDVVDRLIFVAPHIRDILDEMSPGIVEKVKSEVIYNGVDIEKIPFKEREPGYNVAWVGYINYKKNPQMALQVIKKLVDINKRYKLHIAGLYQDLRYKIYLEHMIKEMGLQDNVIFYGWIDDMESFWKDKNYLLHTSLHEGHSLAVNEAMARGVKPVIHNFRGARELYPIDWLFNTIDEAVNTFRAWDYNTLSDRNTRQYIIDKGWTLENQLKEIRKVIEGIKLK